MKRVIAATGLIVAGAFATAALRPSPTPVVWEYQIYAPSNTDPNLNQFGAEGWELVTAVPSGNGYAWIFKRQRP